MPDSNSFDVLIIGCGPAGLSAAIYTARAGLKTIVFGDYKKTGLAKAHNIGNYYGFPGSLPGIELAELGFTHAQKFGAECVDAEIVDIRPEEDGTFTLKDNKQNKYQGRTVIIATGQSFALSGIQNEKEYTGKGVSYCAVCDGFFFKNKKIAVIGNGDFAAEEALHLSNYSKNITILSHGKEFTINNQLLEESEKSGIKLEKTVKISKIEGQPGSSGQPKASGLVLADGQELPFDGIFMAIGTAGATAFAKKLGLDTINGYIKVNNEQETNLKGVYAAGDCTGAPAQVAVSVGHGCIAALSAIKFVRGLNIYIQYN